MSNNILYILLFLSRRSFQIGETLWKVSERTSHQDNCISPSICVCAVGNVMASFMVQQLRR